MHYYVLICTSAPKGDSGPCAGTKYDMEPACQHCGTGAQPVGNRQITGLKPTKKPFIQTFDYTYLIDRKLAEAFHNNGINSLADVTNTRGKRLPFLEIKPTFTLPKFSSTSKGVICENQCAYCKRNGFFGRPHIPLQLIYDNLPPTAFEHNILETYECFGYSAIRQPFEDSGFASPMLVVSQLVVNVFTQEKVNGVDFFPVTIED